MIQSFDSDSASAPTATPARASATSDASISADAGVNSDAPRQPADGNARYSRDVHVTRDGWYHCYGWWLLPALLVVGFGLLIWQVKTNGPVTRLDIHVRDRIQHVARDRSMNWAFHPGRAMADLGNESVTFPILIAVTALAARAARSWRPVLIGLGAFATLGTVIFFKTWLDRPGPGAAVFGNADLGFFPSGHTADSLLCYGTSALLLCVFVLPDHRLNADAHRSRQALVAAAVILVLATIFGLLWSNFHWLSDTVGSLCWCGAALALLSHYATTRQPTNAER